MMLSYLRLKVQPPVQTPHFQCFKHLLDTFSPYKKREIATLLLQLAPAPAVLVIVVVHSDPLVY